MRGGKGWVTLLWNRRGLQVRYWMTGCCHHWFISQRSLLKFLSEKRQRRLSQCQSWISRLQTQPCVKRLSAVDPRLFNQNKNLSALNLNVLTMLARIAIGIAWASESFWKAFALNIAIYRRTTKLQSVIVLTSQLLLDVYTLKTIAEQLSYIHDCTLSMCSYLPGCSFLRTMFFCFVLFFWIVRKRSSDTM